MRLVFVLFVCLSPLMAMAMDCPNHCSGKGQCNSGTGVCVCADGWYGSDCSRDDRSCALGLRNCHGHGLCRAGRCVCHPGYAGIDCSRIATVCAANCTGHGRCVEGRCECEEGYTGAVCETVEATPGCPHNCSGHGLCSGGHCICFAGFGSGPSCDKDLTLCPSSLRNCSGHGLCAAADGSGGHVCHCEPGFCGDDCSTLCSRAVCPANCSGHGICVGGLCSCDPGFMGEDCSTVTAVPTACPNNCTGHGRCSVKNGVLQCVCDPGFQGAACDSINKDGAAECPDNCSGKGECFPTGCQCYSGYSGSACQIALATCESANFCSGNGECEDGVCRCYQGFAGYDCTDACLAGVLGDIGCHEDTNRGTCVNGTCVCVPEFSGPSCASPTDDGFWGLWRPYYKGHNPIGSTTGLVTISVAAAFVLGIVGAIGYKSRGLLKDKSKGLKGLTEAGLTRVPRSSEFGS